MIYGFFDKSTGMLNTVQDGPHIPEDTKYLRAVPFVGAIRECYLDGDIVIDIPKQPSIYHTFNLITKIWEDLRTLDELKSQKWEEIKSIRNAAVLDGFEWDGSRFDSDEVSQGRIRNAAQSALLMPEATVDWRLEDNTLRTLSAADVQQMGLAMSQHELAQHVKANGYRASIDNASSAKAVSAVSWL